MIETDILNYAIKLCISQSDNKGHLQLIAFYLRKIIPAELNYKIYNKKLLTIVERFREQRIYLEESKYQIEIYIDYKNLLYFIIIKALTR